jgi:hypothetical protein
MKDGFEHSRGDTCLGLSRPGKEHITKIEDEGIRDRRHTPEAGSLSYPLSMDLYKVGFFDLEYKIFDVLILATEFRMIGFAAPFNSNNLTPLALLDNRNL